MWDLRFVICESEWNVESLLDLRRVDPESWRRLLKLFDKLSTVPPEGDPECKRSIMEVTRWYEERSQAMCRNAIDHISGAWSAMHRDWMEFLDEVFKQRCLTQEPVTCCLGLSLLSPRNLSGRLFGIPFYVAIGRQLSTCAHEILHFRYFEWLATHYPGISRDQYNYPHEAWLVSEIVAAVLSHHPFAVELFGPGPDACYACPTPLFQRALDLCPSKQSSKLDFKGFYEQLCLLVATKNLDQAPARFSQ